MCAYPYGPKHCFCTVETVQTCRMREVTVDMQHAPQHVQTAGYRLPLQVLVSEKAAANAGFSSTPAAAVAAARKAFRQLLPQLEAPSAEPSLAAARAVATALEAVHRALAGEALLASVSLSLQEAAGQVGHDFIVIMCLEA